MAWIQGKTRILWAILRIADGYTDVEEIQKRLQHSVFCFPADLKLQVGKRRRHRRCERVWKDRHVQIHEESFLRRSYERAYQEAVKKNVQNRFWKCAAYKETKNELKNDHSDQRFRELKNTRKKKCKTHEKSTSKKAGPEKPVNMRVPGWLWAANPEPVRSP